MKRTQSSTGRLIAFTPSLEAELKNFAQEKKETFSWVVRQACIKFLQAQGKSVDAYNPTRGERSDLREIPGGVQ